MIFLFVDAGAEGFVLMFAVVMNCAVVLVALTSSRPPTVDLPAGRRLGVLTITSWTASVAVFVSGFAIVSIISIMPFFLTEHGAPSGLVAMSLAALYLGRLVFQWPIGSLSDHCRIAWIAER